MAVVLKLSCCKWKLWCNRNAQILEVI